MHVSYIYVLYVYMYNVYLQHVLLNLEQMKRVISNKDNFNVFQVYNGAGRETGAE